MLSRFGKYAALLAMTALSAKADTINTPDGLLIIPSGSTVTSESVLNLWPNVYTVNFQFPGGTGIASGDFIDGDHSTITFTMPVTNLSFSATFASSEGDLDVLNGSTGSFFECAEAIQHYCPSQLNETFIGPITSIIIGSGDGSSGIESMSFTEQSQFPINAVSTPEPSSLLLLGVGLFIAFIVTKKMQSC